MSGQAKLKSFGFSNSAVNNYRLIFNERKFEDFVGNAQCWIIYETKKIKIVWEEKTSQFVFLVD
jgi:hypothetical protein